MPLPSAAGASFKPQHFAAVRADAHPPAFIEVHAENYFADGGPGHRQLEALADRLPLSVHGVGLSLGGSAPLDAEHLQTLRRLCDRYRPAAFSEHLAWSSCEGEFLADLLPVPLTAARLQLVAAHIDEAQQALGRPLLIENPSSYLAFRCGELAEAEFLAALVLRTGCGLLLDVNNLFVSASNLGWDVATYLRTLPLAAVGEIHLAGHSRAASGLLIDDHAGRVPAEVWRLYEHVLELAGPRPTLIEWDTSPPEWNVMKDEAARAQTRLDRLRG